MEICNKCYQSNGDGVSKIEFLNHNTIVSCDWLYANLNNEKLIVLDCSLRSNKSGIDPVINNVGIPKTTYFDLLNDFSDASSEWPNTFPSNYQFNKKCQELGINNDSIIVVYDTIGIYSSPRVWWMFQTMGHHNVFVLDGGLPAWTAREFAIPEFPNSSFRKGNFKGVKDVSRIKDFQFMKAYAPICTVQVLDARSKGRFDGLVPEPREGIKSGSIPYSVNIPFDDVLKDGYLKSKKELTEIFGVVSENKRPKVFTCGSGLTACILLLAAKHIGIQDLNIYDGSWTEWATKTQL
jgi:thiosulfate/3-mercaptopyruvate sulfurtransferase